MAECASEISFNISTYLSGCRVLDKNVFEFEIHLNKPPLLKNDITYKLIQIIFIMNHYNWFAKGQLLANK